MPIPIFASYTWQETEGTVTISSRIPGATPANTDFFASPHYVKANSSQVAAGGGLFILESDLFAEIDPKRSAATVSGGMVEIRLHKTTPALWGQLNVQALDKAERMRRRKRSIDAAERAAAADAEASKTAKWEQSRHTLNSQMQLDRAYRGVLEERKSVERAHEEAALDEWQSATERARLDELKQRYGARATAAAAGAMAEAMASPATPHAAAPAAPPRALPPVRARAVIECTFTPKMTAAPLRTKGQHADYDPEPVPLDAPGLRGGGMGPSRARALASGDLYDISQRDPAWLKDRGDRFYRLSDFESAANSYTAVLEQFRDKIPAQAVDCYLACLSNRSACRLQQGELVDAAADATHALSLAESGKSISNIPLTDDELRARARARMQRLLLRRGAALARLGLLEHALADYELALADYAPEGGIGAGAGAHVASPSDLSAGAVRAQLRADVERLREALAALLEAKRRADALAAAATAAAAELGGDGDGGDGAGGEGGGEGGAAESARADAAHALAIDALDAYVDALAGAPFHLGCLANGAAAALFAGAHAKCVAWCDSALRIADAGVVGGAVCAVRVRVKLLLRRATAKTELGHWKGAYGDLRRASAFAPSDNSIVAQLRAVCAAAAERGVVLEDSRSAIAATSSAAIRAEELADGAQAGGGHAEPIESRDDAATVQPASVVKERADQAFAAGRLEDALALYGEALRADAAQEWSALSAPEPAPAAAAAGADGADETSAEFARILNPPAAPVGGVQFRCQCLSNRAACHLKLGDFARAIDDCTAAMVAVRTHLSGDAPSLATPAGSAAAAQGRGYKDALLLKLLLRRAAAYVELGRLEDALGEYEEAHLLAPDNTAVADALRQLRAKSK